MNEIVGAPQDERERLAALIALDVLDTPPEPTFDDLARLAAQLCGTPMALVTLVDARRQWFKARVGVTLRETPREIAFCAHAVAADSAMLVVRDATCDERFCDNPLVRGEPFIRFYAGVPLELASGARVGTLCVLDRVPRELGASQLDALSILARRAASELELRKALGAREHAESGEQELAGQRLGGRYRIDEVLGQGAMGIVVAAHDLEAREDVAIKFLMPTLGADREARDRFVGEARALMRIESEHVSKVRDVGNLASGAPYIVMERLIGRDVATLLRESREPLGVRQAASIVLQACEGIDAAHALGILHRDIKPANLFCAEQPDGSSHVKVLDFGIARVERAASATAATTTGALVGTPSYMAPEQLEDASRVDARSEVWSLGVVLYELLTGAKPYGGRTATQVYAAILVGSLKPPRARRPEIPDALERVILRALEKSPDARFSSVRELARELATFAEDAPPAKTTQSLPVMRDRRAQWITIAVLIAIVVLAAIVALRG
ncbi:protein kinase domain-containing protein [Sandaracinus amylolyticus]|uniref:Sensor histidine kinase n=1 Tax=Sandaracinus amylolyticus TaxID=927083 RepID=A0A0F6YMT0_9BACT|nr:protein kinase [Sandaracinus amylolyticus]AKF11382.1 Sensor histidine kinase [Sandaracinus amylolyticus]